MDLAAAPSWIWKVVSVATLIFSLYWLSIWRTLIRRGSASERTFAGLNRDYLARYRIDLRSTLTALSAVIGDNEAGTRLAWSVQSFLVCLGLATFYPLYFLVLEWALFGVEGHLGGLRVAPGGPSSVVRVVSVFALLSTTILFAVRHRARLMTFAQTVVICVQLILVFAFALQLFGAGSNLIASFHAGGADISALAVAVPLVLALVIARLDQRAFLLPAFIRRPIRVRYRLPNRIHHIRWFRGRGSCDGRFCVRLGGIS